MLDQPPLIVSARKSDVTSECPAMMWAIASIRRSMAAAELGYRCHIFCPEKDSPAAQVSAMATVADYTDIAAITKFARDVDVVTYEFENIPYEPVVAIADVTAVRPSPNVLRIAQDRLKEKDFLNSVGVATARYQEVNDEAGLARAVRDIGRPAVLKTARIGYDGKGQVAVRAETDLAQAWATMKGQQGILEGFIDFTTEISVIVARSGDLSTARVERHGAARGRGPEDDRIDPG